MQIRMLAIVNVVIAIVWASFAYFMLPYAHAVRCEALSLAPCAPISASEQLLATLLPMAIVTAIVWTAFRIRLSHPRTGVVLLSLGPFALLAWLVIAWASSAS
jgi:hypothetical protein